MSTGQGRRSVLGMSFRAVLVAVSLILSVPGAAFASVADEQRQGQALVAQLRSGATSCSDLSGTDFDHIGEYVMGRAVGSTSAHQALNRRMTLTMGAAAESRMHQLMGARAAGCTTAGAAGGAGMMMGGSGMMGTGAGGWSAMMGSRGYSWMRGGAWQHMSRQDWQQLQRQWLRSNPSAHHRNAWNMMAIIGAVLAVGLLGAMLGVAISRRRSSGPPSSAAPSG